MLSSSPALTTMHATSSMSPPPQYPPAYMSPPQQQPPHFTSYQHPQHSQHVSPLSINPSYVQTTSAHYQPSRQQIQHSPHATISPYTLQAPSPPTPQQQQHTFSAVPPSSFYAQPPPSAPAPTGPTPEQRKEKFLSGLRPMLQSTSFTGAGAVTKLAAHISDYGFETVEPTVRLEIFTKMRDNAGNHYFRAWVENEDAMTVTREWLRLAYFNKQDSQLVDTIMPLLQVCLGIMFSSP